MLPALPDAKQEHAGNIAEDQPEDGQRRDGPNGAKVHVAHARRAPRHAHRSGSSDQREGDIAAAAKEQRVTEIAPALKQDGPAGEVEWKQPHVRDKGRDEEQAQGEAGEHSAEGAEAALVANGQGGHGEAKAQAQRIQRVQANPPDQQKASCGPAAVQPIAHRQRRAQIR